MINFIASCLYPWLVLKVTHQESEALKIYFQIQERITEWKSFIRNDLKDRGINIYLMLYPDSESFEMCFSPQQEKFAVQMQGMDKVLGVRGGLQNEDYSSLLSIFRDLVKSPAILEAHA